MKCGCQMVTEDGVVYVCELPRGHSGDHAETDSDGRDVITTVSWPNQKPCIGCHNKADLMRALERRREVR